MKRTRRSYSYAARRAESRSSVGLGLATLLGSATPAWADAYVLETRGKAHLIAGPSLERTFELQQGVLLGEQSRLRLEKGAVVRIPCDDFTSEREWRDSTATVLTLCGASRNFGWKPFRGEERASTPPVLLAPRDTKVMSLDRIIWNAENKKQTFRVRVVEAATAKVIVNEKLSSPKPTRPPTGGVYYFEYRLSDDERARLERGASYTVRVEDGAGLSTDYNKPIALMTKQEVAEVEAELSKLSKRLPLSMPQEIVRAAYLRQRDLSSDAFALLAGENHAGGLHALARLPLVVRRGQEPLAWGRELYRVLFIGAKARNSYVVYEACGKYRAYRPLLPENSSIVRQLDKLLGAKLLTDYASFCPVPEAKKR